MRPYLVVRQPKSIKTVEDHDSESSAKSVHTAIFTINIYGIGHNAICRERDGYMVACGVSFLFAFYRNKAR